MVYTYCTLNTKMGWFDRNTIENLVILMAGILLFNGIINIQFIGTYFKQYPLLIVGIALGLLLMKDKIAIAIAGRRR